MLTSQTLQLLLIVLLFTTTVLILFIYYLHLSNLLHQLGRICLGSFEFSLQSRVFILELTKGFLMFFLLFQYFIFFRLHVL